MFLERVGEAIGWQVNSQKNVGGSLEDVNEIKTVDFEFWKAEIDGRTYWKGEATSESFLPPDDRGKRDASERQHRLNVRKASQTK